MQGSLCYNNIGVGYILHAHDAGLAISREIILFPRAVGNNGKRRDLMGNTGKYREVICPLEKSFDIYYSDPEGPFHMFQDNEI